MSPSLVFRNLAKTMQPSWHVLLLVGAYQRLYIYKRIIETLSHFSVSTYPFRLFESMFAPGESSRDDAWAGHR